MYSSFWLNELGSGCFFSYELDNYLYSSYMAQEKYFSIQLLVFGRQDFPFLLCCRCCIGGFLHLLLETTQLSFSKLNLLVNGQLPFLLMSFA